MALGGEPTKVLRVVIRCPDVATFVAKYARFIKDDRIFIFTKSSQEPGTRVRFSLELADGRPLLSGDGTVVRTRGDSGDAGRPPGMELKFVPIDDFSREMVEKVLQVRALSAAAGSTFTGPTSSGPSQPPPLPPVPKMPPPHPRHADPPDPPEPLLSPLSSPHVAQSDSQEIETNPRPDSTGPSALRQPKVPLAAWSTETPLPAHAPAGIVSPVQGLPTLTDEGRLADDGPAPVFAEAQAGTVPANPFSQISDGAIEYFVEWGIEQSTKAKPQPGSFADVAMHPPRAESRVPAAMWIGLAVGFGIGAPLGALGLWAYSAGGDRVTRPVVAAVAKPVDPPPPVAATAPPSGDAPASPTSAAPASPTGATPATAPPPGATPANNDGDELPAAPPMLLHPHKHMGIMRIHSTPPGCDVVVKGQPRGKTPLEVELPSGHRYDVEVLLPGGKWKRRVNLASPATEIHASLTHRPK